MKPVFNHFAAAVALIGIISIPCTGFAAENTRTVTTITTERAPVVRRHVVVRRRHPVRKTIKRVGIGAAGGAVAGAVIGGGPGAAIGAVAGGGAGAIYDQHEKHIGK
jgi:uncharacterized protein YcfJ